jgi:hypothetical protein
MGTNEEEEELNSNMRNGLRNGEGERKDEETIKAIPSKFLSSFFCCTSLHFLHRGAPQIAAAADITAVALGGGGCCHIRARLVAAEVEIWT